MRLATISVIFTVLVVCWTCVSAGGGGGGGGGGGPFGGGGGGGGGGGRAKRQEYEPPIPERCYAEDHPCDHYPMYRS